MKKLSIHAISALMISAMFDVPRYRPARLIEEDYPPEAPPSRKKMDLTEEEAKKLSSLIGKEKKRYLKDLKKKYSA